VAQAVVDHLAFAVGSLVSRAEVWLVQAPEDVHATVRVGRGGRCWLRFPPWRKGGGSWLRPKKGFQPLLHAGPALLERAITRVVVAFWFRLRSFAVLGLPRNEGMGLGGPPPSISAGGVRVVCWCVHGRR
jgi:hypothetical protein